MSDKQNNQISFTFIKITTEQFALLDDYVGKKENFNLQTQFKFGVNSSNKVLAIYCLFRFIHEEKPFLILETSSQFKIKDNSWGFLIDQKNNNISFPRNFVIYLTMLAVGTARGILHAKTEDSIFSNMILPAINVDKIINSDVVLSLKEEELSS